MAATPSLTIITKMTYRANTNEEFSNTYHFLGGTPANATEWKALADAVIAQYKTTQPSANSIVRAYGHAASTPAAVWSYDYAANAASVAGTLNTTGGDQAPGDAAIWLRWDTANFVNGKRVYLRKYFHGVYTNGPGSGDYPLTGQKSAVVTYGTAWVTGFISATYKIAGPQGAAGSNPVASTYITTRTLKRRGKRTTP